VTVTLRDVNGDPIVVGGDKVTLNTNLGVLGAVTDHGDGTYSASLSGAAAGTATVTFTVNGADATNTADVTLVAVPAASAPPVEPAPPVESAPPVEAGLASTGINIETGLAYVGLLLGAGLLLALAKWKRRTNAS
jgi:adhesin/invasin